MFDRVPCPRTDFFLEELDDEILLYHPSRTVMLYVNPSAALIWRLCDGQRTVQEIVTLLQNAYPLADENISSEVERVLVMFEQQGALEYV